MSLLKTEIAQNKLTTSISEMNSNKVSFRTFPGESCHFQQILEIKSILKSNIDFAYRNIICKTPSS